MTPFFSGMPINSIPPPTTKDLDLAQRTKCYQNIVGCINWLVTCMCPDLSPALTFLASYSHAPTHQNYKPALDDLKYLYITADYDIFSL
jgi:hypothetical protein